MEPSTWDMYMSTMRNETVARYLDPELHELVSNLRSELSEQNEEMLALQAKNDKLRGLLGKVLGKWLEDADPDELAWLVNSAKMEL